MVTLIVQSSILNARRLIYTVKETWPMQSIVGFTWLLILLLLFSYCATFLIFIITMSSEIYIHYYSLNVLLDECRVKESRVQRICREKW